jgi:hypothetical protein
MCCLRIWEREFAFSGNTILGSSGEEVEIALMKFPAIKIFSFDDLSDVYLKLV